MNANEIKKGDRVRCRPPYRTVIGTVQKPKIRQRYGKAWTHEVMVTAEDWETIKADEYVEYAARTIKRAADEKQPDGTYVFELVSKDITHKIDENDNIIYTNQQKAAQKKAVSKLLTQEEMKEKLGKTIFQLNALDVPAFEIRSKPSGAAHYRPAIAICWEHMEKLLELIEPAFTKETQSWNKP